MRSLRLFPWLLPLAAVLHAAAPIKLTVQLDWVAEPEHGGFYQAEAKGYFADEGLDVTIVPGGPNAFVMPKVATGQADIGQADSTNTLLQQAQGLPVVQIGAVFQDDAAQELVYAAAAKSADGDSARYLMRDAIRWKNDAPYVDTAHHRPHGL